MKVEASFTRREVLEAGWVLGVGWIVRGEE